MVWESEERYQADMALVQEAREDPGRPGPTSVQRFEVDGSITA